MFITNIFKINSIKWFNLIFLNNKNDSIKKKSVHLTSNSIFFWINCSAVYWDFVTIIGLSLVRCIFIKSDCKPECCSYRIRSVELLLKKIKSTLSYWKWIFTWMEKKSFSAIRFLWRALAKWPRRPRKRR